jgi:hypothetical protein
VDALAAQIAGLVETVLLGTRLSDLDDRAQEGTLRWRASRREVESRALARILAPETQNERASPARTGHLEKRGTRPADLRAELAVVQNLQTDAAPPHSSHEKRGRQS